MFTILVKPILLCITAKLKGMKASLIRACADDMAIILRDVKYLTPIAAV